MTTVIPFKSETIPQESEEDGFRVTAESLRTRRSELAFLEARCGEETTFSETGWRQWLFPAAAAALAAGFGLAASTGDPGLRVIAALAFGLWTATSADRLIRTTRQAILWRGGKGRRVPMEAATSAIQAVGATALVWMFAPSAVSMLLLCGGAATGMTRGWIAGGGNPQTERLREDLDEARAELASAEDVFERDIEAARSTLDAKIERARQAAGQTPPTAQAAE